MATRPNWVKQLEQVAKLEDFALGVDGLRQKYDAQGEHPYFDREEWRRAVRDDETLSGYWDWVASALDEQLNDATLEINASERADAIAAALKADGLSMATGTP